MQMNIFAEIGNYFTKIEVFKKYGYICRNFL